MGVGRTWRVRVGVQCSSPHVLSWPLQLEALALYLAALCGWVSFSLNELSAFWIMCVVAWTFCSVLRQGVHCFIVLCEKNTCSIVFNLPSAAFSWWLVCRGGGIYIGFTCNVCLYSEVNGFSTQCFDAFKRGGTHCFRIASVVNVGFSTKPILL